MSLDLYQLTVRLDTLIISHVEHQGRGNSNRLETLASVINPDMQSTALISSCLSVPPLHHLLLCGGTESSLFRTRNGETTRHLLTQLLLQFHHHLLETSHLGRCICNWCGAGPGCVRCIALDSSNRFSLLNLETSAARSSQLRAILFRTLMNVSLARISCSCASFCARFCALRRGPAAMACSNLATLSRCDNLGIANGRHPLFADPSQRTCNLCLGNKFIGTKCGKSCFQTADRKLGICCSVADTSLPTTNKCRDRPAIDHALVPAVSDSHRPISNSPSATARRLDVGYE